jgi:hypothetical protein
MKNRLMILSLCWPTMSEIAEAASVDDVIVALLLRRSYH